MATQQPKTLTGAALQAGLGTWELRNGRPEAAYRRYQDALVRDPGNSQALFWKGVAAAMLARHGEASTCFQQARVPVGQAVQRLIELLGPAPAPELVQKFLEIGQLAQNRTGLAIAEVFVEALARSGSEGARLAVGGVSSTGCWGLLGLATLSVLKAERDFARAERYLERVLELYPAAARQVAGGAGFGYVQLAVWAGQADADDRASRYLARAAVLSADNLAVVVGNAHYGCLAVTGVMARHGRFEMAEKLLSWVERAAPAQRALIAGYYDPETGYVLGYIGLAQQAQIRDQLDQAEVYLDRALAGASESRPHVFGAVHPSGQNGLPVRYGFLGLAAQGAEDGDFGRTEVYLERALELMPERADTVAGAGCKTEEKQRYGYGGTAFEAVRQKQPRLAQRFFNRAIALAPQRRDYFVAAARVLNLPL